ncbi:MAG TPA: hypothetical protein DCL16_09705 [Acidimicrobiaceae bacterium]|nr:hypothetical protein [Acidimicrobiaceae bacterium]
MTIIKVVSSSDRPQELPKVAASSWKILIATCLTNFVIGLDLSITNVAIPNIEQSFSSASTADISWCLTFYMLTYAGALIVSGRWADRFGRVRVLNGGFTCLVFGSALLAFAPTVPLLIAARGLIGVGAAMAAPASLGIAIASWPPERRATAVTIWSSTLALSSVVGPIIGGFVIELSSWRWAFALNIPIGIGALIWGARVLPESDRDPDVRRPDLLGSVLITAATSALALFIVKGSEWGWSSPRVLGLFMFTALGTGCLIRRISRHADPILPRSLLAIPSFRVAICSLFLFGLGFFSSMLIVVLYLTELGGYSTVRTGLGISVMASMAFTTANFSGRLADRFGHRRVAVPGMCCFIIGCLWLYQNAGASPNFFVDLFPALLLMGLGIGSGPTLLSAAAVSEVDPSNFSVAGAVAQTARQLSGAIGISIAVAISGSNADESSFRATFLYLAVVVAMATVTALRLSMDSQPRGS